MRTIAVDLTVDAAAEARRLTAARALLREGDQRALLALESGDTWIAVSKRTKLRLALGRRVCLVWRLSLEDESGRLVESRLVPMLVDGAADVDRMPWDAVSDAAMRGRIDGESEAWSEEAMRVAHAFAAARLTRERDIAAVPPPADPLGQPGLFDRRAERSLQAQAQSVAAARHAAVERLRAIERADAISLRPARLLLVLMA